MFARRFPGALAGALAMTSLLFAAGCGAAEDADAGATDTGMPEAMMPATSTDTTAGTP